MLIDNLKNASAYYNSSPNLAKALQWLNKHQNELPQMENGQYEIDGQDVYAIVNSYSTKPAADCGWEAHKIYCDIHYSVSGSERIGYAPMNTMTEIQAYNAEKDYSLYNGKGDWVWVGTGMFCLLMPQDVHAPGFYTHNQPEFLKKVVIKLKY